MPSAESVLRAVGAIDRDDKLVRVKSWWPYWDGRYLCWPTLLVDVKGYKRMTVSRCWWPK